MSANPHANGGLLLRDLNLPDFRDYTVPVSRPGAGQSEATRVLGGWLRDVIRRNPATFRLFGPDETASNRLTPVFEATDRAFDAEKPSRGNLGSIVTGARDPMIEAFGRSPWAFGPGSLLGGSKDPARMALGLYRQTPFLTDREGVVLTIGAT